jgi:hypothetical protein
LSRDGTIVFTNVPDWWNTAFGESGGQFDSASGTWKLALKQNQWWALRVTFPPESPLASNGKRAVTFTTTVSLIGEKPPYTLHLTIGDPDEGNAMQFVRKPSTGGR